MQLTEATERYIAAKGLTSPHSVRNQRKQALRLVTYLGRDPDLKELDDETLSRWWKERGKAVCQNSVNTEGTLLLAVLRWGHRKGWCEWPDAQPPGKIRRAPQALTIEQTQRLLDTAAKLKGNFRGVPACIRWRAYLLLALKTGERIGAIRALQWRDLEADIVTFRAETRKGGSSEKIDRLPAVVVEALADLKAYGEPTPFAWLERTAVYAHWHALRQLADLPEWCRPHTLRKTAASHCATLEGAQALLGHGSSATTRKAYRDPRITSPTESALIDALSKPRSKWFPAWLTG
jgi:integrase